MTSYHKTERDHLFSRFFYNALNNLWQACPRLMINVREMIAVACWYIWWIRRRRIHDEPVPPVKYRATSILGLTANFIKSCYHCAAPSGAKWVRPLSNHVKLNVDATFLADARAGATATAIRDDKGWFLAGSCAYSWNTLSRWQPQKRWPCVMKWSWQ
jgi:hypothetical protein